MKTSVLKINLFQDYGCSVCPLLKDSSHGQFRRVRIVLSISNVDKKHFDSKIFLHKLEFVLELILFSCLISLTAYNTESRTYNQRKRFPYLNL